MITIHKETDSHRSIIRKINESAFGKLEESNLIESLRTNGKIDISFVAKVNDQVVGHILFSPVFIENTECPKRGSALGPVAVLPEFQKKEVGSALINESLKQCKNIGIDYVILLGHKTYYPRFGFKPLKNYGLTSTYGNGEHIMVHELTKGSLNFLSGKICYQPEFQENKC